MGADPRGAAVPDSSDLAQRLKATVAAEMEKLQVPGVSAALMRGGAIAWRGCFGTADPATGVPVDEETLFPACSCSKPVAAFAALRLAERGELDLDAPIEELLKSWKPPTRPFFGPVTVRLLLAHRAGLSIHGAPGYAKDDPQARTCREELAHTLRFLEEPGTRFRYSGGGFMVLQVILEDVSGKSFNALMETDVRVRCYRIGRTSHRSAKMKSHRDDGWTQTSL